MFHVKDAEFNPTARQGVYGGYQSWVDRAGRFRSLGDGQVDFNGDILEDAAIRFPGLGCARMGMLPETSAGRRARRGAVHQTAHHPGDRAGVRRFRRLRRRREANRRMLGIDCETLMTTRRLRWGLVGGGQGAFIGAVHRIAARLDDRYELVAGALSSTPSVRARPRRELASAAGAQLSQTSARWPQGSRTQGRHRGGSHRHAQRRACERATTFLEAGIHVICDKPLAIDACRGADDSSSACANRIACSCVTYKYTGYPLVRQAREMVAAGEIGAVQHRAGRVSARLARRAARGQRQQAGAWRTDPARSGPGGCLGDIGTHAFHLAGFVTGLMRPKSQRELEYLRAGAAAR